MFDNWRKRRKQARYTEGYNFAAGKLLRSGAEIIFELEMNVGNARAWGTYDEFDSGIEDAVVDYRLLTGHTT